MEWEIIYVNKKQSVVFQCLSGPFQNFRLKRVKRLKQVKEGKRSVRDTGFPPSYLKRLYSLTATWKQKVP